ncbi:hypothetical protein TNCV_744621 [Trichonephila clavipes]|nr:hypothetical protein TNCV_744621 [Trichonephila clavipes]
MKRLVNDYEFTNKHCFIKKICHEKGYKSVCSKSNSVSYTSQNTEWHRSMADHAVIFATRQLVHEYSGTATVAFKARLKRALLARGLVTWKAMEVPHIHERIAERVAKYGVEHCITQ